VEAPANPASMALEPAQDLNKPVESLAMHPAGANTAPPRSFRAIKSKRMVFSACAVLGACLIFWGPNFGWKMPDLGTRSGIDGVAEEQEDPGTVSSKKPADAVLYPSPGQVDVPCARYDRVVDGKTGGFPVSVTFPGSTKVRNVKATLTDESGRNVEVQVFSPEQPLNTKLPQPTIGLRPLQPLEAGNAYTVVVTATVNETAWRQCWNFVTSK
jgi:hypothetical protein